MDADDLGTETAFRVQGVEYAKVERRQILMLTWEGALMTAVGPVLAFAVGARRSTLPEAL